MQKRNIATALLGFLGLKDAFRTAVPNEGAHYAIKPEKGNATRFRASMQARARRKAEFEDMMAAEFKPPKHVKLARKAHMGEVGLRGRRGMMVRRIEGRLRITA